MVRAAAAVLAIAILGVSSLTSLSFADSITPLFSISQATNLKKGKTYSFRFSLWDQASNGAMYWSEEKNIKLGSKTLQHVLGSVNPAGNPISPAYFSSQLYLQIDYRSGSTRKVIGTRRALTITPYAMHALSVTPSSIGSGDIEANSIGSSHIQDGAVNDSKISGTISSSKLDAALVQHLSRNDNPHNVTAAQAGAAAANHAHYARTIIVSGGETATANGDALREAFDGITDASFTNRYIVVLGPETYNLGTTPLTMKPYVDLRGSGPTSTVVSGRGAADDQHPTIIMPTSTRISELTVDNGGLGAYAIAIAATDAFSSLDRVTLQASGGTTGTSGIELRGASSMELNLVSISSTGGTGDACKGIVVNDTSRLTLRDSSIRVSCAATVAQGVQCLGAYCELNESSVAVSGGTSLSRAMRLQSGIHRLSRLRLLAAGATAYGIDLFGVEELTANSVDVEVTAATLGAGVKLDSHTVVPRMRDFDITVTDDSAASTNYGIWAISSSFELAHSRVVVESTLGTTRGLDFEAAGYTARLVGVNFSMTGGNGNTGLWCSGNAATPPIIDASNTTVYSFGGAAAYGINSSDCLTHAQASSFTAAGAATNLGAMLNGTTGTFLQRFDNCQIAGSSFTIINDAENAVRLGNSLLYGGNRLSTGPVNCFAVYDEAYTSPGLTSCPL